MKRIAILTGNELRHKYFRIKVASTSGINVLASYCESDEKSLLNKTKRDPASSVLQNLHASAREQAEKDYFEETINSIEDKSLPRLIEKGSVNDNLIVDEIKGLKPDLLVCYGSSLIRSELLKIYCGRFLNVHLGLSPYYRGSGTNVWPIINGEHRMVGATFMHIDYGIDTGKIIHQIQADFFIGDSPHSVGNRLIRKMTTTYCEIINKFDVLSVPDQPSSAGSLFLSKDFNAVACERLYEMYHWRSIYDYITKSKHSKNLNIVINSALWS
jgi:phosphoribosylglycinamide formyltransferase-1